MMITHSFEVQRRISNKTGKPYNVMVITWQDEQNETIYQFETFVNNEQSYCLNTVLAAERESAFGGK